MGAALRAKLSTSSLKKLAIIYKYIHQNSQIKFKEVAYLSIYTPLGKDSTNNTVQNFKSFAGFDLISKTNSVFKSLWNPDFSKILVRSV